MLLRAGCTSAFRLYHALGVSIKDVGRLLWLTGDSYVNFYADGLQSDDRLRYASYQYRASMPSGWNDRVTSLRVLDPGVACP